MAWTTPRTWTTGETVTKTIMDTHVKDNLDYLKTQTDRLSVSQIDQVGSRACDTAYQNTSGRNRLVQAVIQPNTSYQITAVTGATSSPTAVAGSFVWDAGTATISRVTITFLVPPTLYYKVVSNSSDGAVIAWVETDL